STPSPPASSARPCSRASSPRCSPSTRNRSPSAASAGPRRSPTPCCSSPARSPATSAARRSSSRADGSDRPCGTSLAEQILRFTARRAISFGGSVMPSWTPKDERQYEHIRDSELERGVGEDRAEEIAARTVNKRRRVEGRTPSSKTQGTGNPRRRFEDRSVDELRNLASERK